MPDELRAVTKTYDFMLWLLPQVAKFSRDHRFTLGNRLEEGALEVKVACFRAFHLASNPRPNGSK